MAMARYEAEKFNGRNDFGLWKIKMKALLTHQGLAEALDPIEPGERPTAKQTENMKKAHSAIILNLDDKVLREVAREETASAMWKKLDELYLTKSLANRLYLKQRLYSFRFLDDHSISEQLDQFNKLIDDLENVDAKMNEEDKAIALLNALPKSFEQLRDAMLYGREKAITITEVQSALKTKDLQRLGGVREGAGDVLTLKKFKGKGKNKFQQQKFKEKEVQKETRSCHYCKKPGHLKKNCFSWKRKQNEEAQAQASTDVVEEVEPMRILNIVESDVGEKWIIDSGCSFHVCSHREWFEEFHSAQGSVLLGNNQSCIIQGIGKIKLRLEDGSLIVLTEVRLIQEIKRNLISLGVLQSKGCQFRSGEGTLQICKGPEVIMTAVKRNSLYYLAATVVLGAACVVSQNDASVWHKRLAHVGQKGMEILSKNGLIQCSNMDSQLKCEDCIMGKGRKLPFPKGKHTSKAPLDYAHSDLWGPAQPHSMGGGKYFMTIIDDFSRKLWVYILKEKSEAFKYFKEWHVLVEKQRGSSLKCLRTDNGLEYLSAEFDNFCKERGIRRHKTVARNPQQNGVAERMNRTILERVRCMLLASGVPKTFWAEAVMTAAKVINKCPSSAIDFQIPDEKWYGERPDFSRLKPFGCRVYAHVKAGKLETRAVKCILLGYQDGVKGYRLWNQESQKLMVSRDVIFDESRMPYLPSEQARKEDESDLEVELLNKDTSEEVAGESPTSEAVVGRSPAPSRSVPPIANRAPASPYKLARDRTRRQNKPPQKYGDYDMLSLALCVAENIIFNEPSNFGEAMRSMEKEKWIRAMEEEIDSLLRNGTWILVDRSDLQKAVGCKWIFKKKIEASQDDAVRFKARLVAKGYTQQEGIDYNEVFSPVVKHSTIRVVLAVVTQLNWELHQLDVKTAFLHGELEETIFMEQPEGFEVKGEENKVCLLKKSIYGLKQSSRQWYLKFDSHIADIGFEKSAYDNCLYIRNKGGNKSAYLVLYVDDMLVAAEDLQEVEQIKRELGQNFEMKNLGEARRILGIDISRDRSKGELRLSQADYISKILGKFKVQDSKEKSIPLAGHFKLSSDQSPKSVEEEEEMSSIPYSNIIGSIMYSMICTRVDLAHAVSVTSRFMKNHGREHWIALKWVLKYLKGSKNLGILYKKSERIDENSLVGYCDSDYASSIDTRKSQTGYVFNLFGSAVSWKSTLQPVVALSTTEAEYIALTEAIKEGVWLKGVMGDLGLSQTSVTILCDSNSAICLAKHQVHHERTKHIDVRLHFIRDIIERGEIKVEKVGTEDNAADALTKPLPVSKFKHCLKLVSMVDH